MYEQLSLRLSVCLPVYGTDIHPSIHPSGQTTNGNVVESWKLLVNKFIKLINEQIHLKMRHLEYLMHSVSKSFFVGNNFEIFVW